MRVVLLLLLLCSLASAAVAQGQSGGAQGYTPQTWTPQTWSPQQHSPQTHAPQTWTPQTGGDTRPRRRVVKCTLSNAPDEFCTFFSDRDLRPGSACSCGDGSRGTVN
jgi:hypothetical protein